MTMPPSTFVSWEPCHHVWMIVSFKDKETEDIFNGVNSKQTRKACPQALLSYKNIILATVFQYAIMCIDK